MIIRKFTSADIDPVHALQHNYARAFPGARVVPCELYLSPAFHGGQDVFCAFEGDRLLAYAPLYLQAVESGPEELPHTAWVEIKVSPALEDPKTVKDALIRELLRRTLELARPLPNRPVRMTFEYKPVEAPSIDYVQSKGFAYTESIYGMQRALAIPVPDVALPPGIRLQRTKMENETDQIEYVAARNECFPEGPVTLGEWQHFLGLMIWPTGTTIAAYDGEMLVGNVSAFWSSEEVAQSQEKPGYTEYIFVRLAWQGRGIATAMIAEGLRFLQSNGLDVARLEVRAQNEGALAVYQKLGYKVLAENRLFSKIITPGIPSFPPSS